MYAGRLCKSCFRGNFERIKRAVFAIECSAKVNIYWKGTEVGCVGCGRCSSACLAGIASPLEAFNAGRNIRLKEAATSVIQAAKPARDIYTPEMAEILSVRQLTEKEKVFELKLKRKNWGITPDSLLQFRLWYR